MKSRKICIIGPSKLFLSGISYYMIRLANTLSSSNEVSVVSLRKLLPPFLFPGKDRIGKHLTDLNYLPHIENFNGIDYNSISSWYKAIKFLEKENPDLIVFQWWTSSVAHMHIMIKIFNALKMKAKCVFEMHEVADPIEEKNALLKIYSYLTGRILMSNTEAFIVHSESDRKLVSERYKIDMKRIHVISLPLYDHYEIINKDVAQRKLGIKDKFVILYFGLIRPYKGVQYLIEAFESLPPDIVASSKLLIIGEVWENCEDIVNKIKTSKSYDKIFTKFEYVHDREVPIYFSASDLVILPYTRASQSAVAHIAMCFGKPIIVSHVGGLKESMVEYEGTLFVPPKDPQSITKAIEKVYYQKDYKGYQAPNRSWDKISRTYINLLKNL